jgi:hypothetical protein
MDNIYYLFLMAICAVGVFLTGLYSKQIVMRYKRYRARLKRNSLEARVEQLEMRVDLHTRKDSAYLDKFDEMEKLFAQRERDRKAKVRKQVLEYLKELQGNG